LLQVIVAQTPRGRGPVPWAYVSRGGGSAVHLFVAPQRGKQAFFDDWSVVHEMAHLFFPYVAGRDAWLFEGLPTYLQNVLMARDGAISSEEAWRRMAAGFRRGARISPGLSLSRVAERMSHGGNYLRVYWAGAAAMLAADLQLRSLSTGSQSLDTALASLSQCCLQDNRRWSARELIEKLDQLTATTVFSDLWHQQIETGEFPDFETVLARAGVDVENGQVRFLPTAPWAAEREVLMQSR
jgi:predicted metalloprotease with PDZ domain